MSVVIASAPGQRAARVGPRGFGQQFAGHKWSVQVSQGYWLYIGVPTTEVSEAASRNALLAADGDEKVIGALARRADALVSVEKASDRPTSLKVYYTRLPFGDISPTPRLPRVTDARGRERAPSDAEKEFTVYCTNVLPMYDITLRVDERKSPNAVARLIGTAAAQPLDADGAPTRLPYGLDAAPFSTWRVAIATPSEPARPGGIPLKDFISEKNMAEFASGCVRRGGVVELRAPSAVEGKPPVTLSGRFTEVAAYSIKGPSGVFCTKIAFSSAASVADALKGADAVITFRHEPGLRESPLLELRVSGGSMKRACFPFDATVFWDPPRLGADPGAGAFLLTALALLLESLIFTVCPPLGLTLLIITGGTAGAVLAGEAGF